MTTGLINDADDPFSKERWELAGRVAGQARAPEDAIRKRFQGIIRDYEQLAIRTVDASLRERVWQQVSRAYIAALKQELLTQVCLQILKLFPEDKVHEMLVEQMATGHIRKASSAHDFSQQYQMAQDSIVKVVEEKALSMETELAQDIISVLH